MAAENQKMGGEQHQLYLCRLWSCFLLCILLFSLLLLHRLRYYFHRHNDNIEQCPPPQDARAFASTRPPRTSLPSPSSGPSSPTTATASWGRGALCGCARRRGLGAREWLETLPGVVVCGRCDDGGRVRDVWRLDLATMRWERMPSLLVERDEHACCAVRGRIVVLGGETSGDELLSSVEMLHFSAGEEGGGGFVNLPPLSCGGIYAASGITVEESHSAAGQVLLLGGHRPNHMLLVDLVDVRLVDLATGICTPQPSMLHERFRFAAGRLKDGRVVCAGGGNGLGISAEVYGPPAQGAPDAPWTWTELPAMSVSRYGCCGCVMSDGRFAVLGGWRGSGPMSSCEALDLGSDTDAHWVPLPSMHQPRSCFTCAAVAGSIIVAGGSYTSTTSAEVYDEVLDRCFRLPRDLPHDGPELECVGCALL